jgi:hypothetical protein
MIIALICCKLICLWRATFSRDLRGAAAHCGCRTNVAHDVHVPSYSHTATPSIGLCVGLDYDQDEIGPSQLQGAPSTQPLQPEHRR